MGKVSLKTHRTNEILFIWKFKNRLTCEFFANGLQYYHSNDTKIFGAKLTTILFTSNWTPSWALPHPLTKGFRWPPPPHFIPSRLIIAHFITHFLPYVNWFQISLCVCVLDIISIKRWIFFFVWMGKMIFKTYKTNKMIFVYLFENVKIGLFVNFFQRVLMY